MMYLVVGTTAPPQAGLPIWSISFLSTVLADCQQLLLCFLHDNPLRYQSHMRSCRLSSLAHEGVTPPAWEE
jgi:hypothetical protein